MQKNLKVVMEKAQAWIFQINKKATLGLWSRLFPLCYRIINIWCRKIAQLT